MNRRRFVVALLEVLAFAAGTVAMAKADAANAVPRIGWLSFGSVEGAANVALEACTTPARQRSLMPTAAREGRRRTTLNGYGPSTLWLRSL